MLSVAALTLCGLAGCGPDHPTDAALRARFTAHRAEFERLRQMFDADAGLSRVGSDFTRPEDPASVGVGAARLAGYRSLFAVLGLADGIERGPEDEIWFRASSSGLSVSGSAKGFVWTASIPDPLVDRLDGYSEDGHSFTAYSRIDGNWYLVYDFED
jgi:hypothetical protein